MRRVVLFAFLLTAGVLVYNRTAWTAGPVHGAKGAAMGTAFAAVADDPSAIAHNPAGLGYLEGTHVYAGVTAVSSDTGFSGAEGTDESTRPQIFFPPHLYASSALNTETVVVGMGIFSPFGIGGRKWSDEGMFRFVSTESYIVTMAANPVMAWRPVPSLSLSVGAVYLWTLDRMERRVDQSAVGAADGTIRFDADGDGWGWNAGLLWKVGDRFQIGAAYRSAIHVDLSGDMKIERIAPPLQPPFGGSSFLTPASMRVNFPAIATLGMAWRPAPAWILCTEVEWGDWSSFDQQRIDVQDPVPVAGFDDVDIPLNWDDGWIFKLGIEYRVTERLALRGGYTYLTRIVPDETLSPANPDADQHYIHLGAGTTVGRLDIDAFYSFGIYQDRQVSNAIADGAYRTLSQQLGVSVGWRF